jgi:O-antigen/teichoic acid export membrane protein
MSKPLAAGIWYSVSNIMLRSVSIITAPIFTRLLTTADYGKISNFTSWQNICAIFMGLFLNYSIGRAKIDFKNDFNSYISSIQGLSSVIGILVLIIVIPYADSIAEFMEIDKVLLITMVVYLFFYPSIEYMQSKLRFEYRYKENVLIAITNTLSVVVISIVLILSSEYEEKYVGRIQGIVYPSFIIAVICFIIISIKGRKFVVLDYWKYALKFSIPMIPHALAMIVLAQIDRIMIVKMVGDREAGIYSFGYSYAIVLSVITNAIINAWQPWLYNCANENKIDEIKKSNKEINIFVSILTVLFVLVTPEVLMLLGTKDFWEAKYMVGAVIIGTFFQFLYSYFVLMEMYCKKTIIIAVGSIIAAVTNFCLNLIFIPKYGYISAAYTTMIGYLLLMMYHWIAFKLIYKPKIFAEKQILILTIVTPIICLIMMFNYDNIVLRYIVSFLMIFLYSGRLKKILNIIMVQYKK